jgi:hypothetical protein
MITIYQSIGTFTTHGDTLVESVTYKNSSRAKLLRQLNAIKLDAKKKGMFFNYSIPVPVPQGAIAISAIGVPTGRPIAKPRFTGIFEPKYGAFALPGYSVPQATEEVEPEFCPTCQGIVDPKQGCPRC